MALGRGRAGGAAAAGRANHRVRANAGRAGQVADRRAARTVPRAGAGPVLPGESRVVLRARIPVPGHRADVPPPTGWLRAGPVGDGPALDSRAVRVDPAAIENSPVLSLVDRGGAR